jgi:hypothetical protein
MAQSSPTRGNTVTLPGIMNGDTWDDLGGGVTGFDAVVKAIVEHNGYVYVGGTFDTAGEVAARNIARYKLSNPQEWEAIGIGTDAGPGTMVNEIVVHNGLIYVGGYFTQMNGQTIGNLAVYDPSGSGSWSSIGTFGHSDPEFINVFALHVFGDDLYVGGEFQTITKGGTELEVQHLARYDITDGDWHRVGTYTSSDPSDIPFMDGTVMAIDGNDTELVFSGMFSQLEEESEVVVVNGIVRYNPAGSGTWTSLSPGVGESDFPSTATYGDGVLYVAGDFYTDFDLTTRIKAYSIQGNTWTSIGGVFNNSVIDLKYHNGALFVTGDFTQVGEVTTAGIAKYDPVGGAWSTFGTGVTSFDGAFSGAVSLGFAENKLIVGGIATAAGGVPVNNIARWSQVFGDGGGDGGGGGDDPALPGAFTVSSTVPATLNIGPYPRFEWNASTGAVSYSLEITKTLNGSEPDFSPGALIAPLFGITDLFFDFSDLGIIRLEDANTEYHWRVVAGNSTGFTTSNVRSFTTMSVPANFSLSTPTTGAENQPVRTAFAWETSTHAESYTLQIALDADVAFSSPVLSYPGILTNSHTLSEAQALTHGTIYHWRVLAVNEFASGEDEIVLPTQSTETLQFTTQSLELTAPTLVAPTPDPAATDVPLTPTFTWSKVELATGYTLSYYVTASGSGSATSVPLIIGDLTDTGLNYSYTLLDVNKLLPGTNYTWSVTATAAGLDPGSSATATFTTEAPVVLPAAITLTGPTEVTAGVVSGNFTLTVVDSEGSPAAVSEATTFALSSTSDGTKTFNPASPITVPDGQSSVTFTYTDTKAGKPTVTATWASGDVNLNAPASATHSITVNVGTATKLAFVTPPTPGVVNTPLPQFQVAIVDLYDNVVTSSSASVNVAKKSGSGAIGGTLTVAAVAGVATFDNIIINAATTDLIVTFTSGALTSLDSPAITVAAFGDPAQLAFVTEPTNTEAGATMSQVRVGIQDAAGNLVTDATNTVYLFMGTNPVTGTLTGTLSVAVEAGIATFSDLKIDKAGIGYTLMASDATPANGAGGLADATSNEFNITPPQPTQIVFTTAPHTIAIGATSGVMTIELRGSDNLPATRAEATTVALSSDPSAGVAFLNEADVEIYPQIQIPAGETRGSFKFKSATAGSKTITASSGTLTTATQTLTVHPFESGRGVEGDPFVIKDVYQLQAMKDYLDKHFKLGDDIDASSTGEPDGLDFEPVGSSSSTAFKGSLDGAGFKITGLTIDRPSSHNVGLFGRTESEAIIRNVSLEEVNIKGDYYVGGLIGINKGTITNSSSSGSVSGAVEVGGLVGENFNGSITNSYSSGSVTGSGSAVGGLVGRNMSIITNSYSNVSVTGSGIAVGGLIGLNSSVRITNSYSSGSVTGFGNNVGGLVGLFGGGTSESYTSSYWDIDTSGQDESAGGTGKTTADMRKLATFEGWDFTDIWAIGLDFNDGYPRLLGFEYTEQPTASEVDITGDLEVDVELTATYTYRYTGPDGPTEGATSFQWFRSDDNLGTNKVAIDDATEATYTLTEADKDKFLSIRITPRTNTAIVGVPVESGYRGPITPPKPQAFNLLTPENPSDNNTVTPTFTWEQSENAESYVLNISTAESMADPVFTSTSLTRGEDLNEVSFTLPSESRLRYGETYHWQVVASANGVDVESGVSKFSTRAEGIVLTNPGNGRIFTSVSAVGEEAFTWEYYLNADFEDINSSLHILGLIESGQNSSSPLIIIKGRGIDSSTPSQTNLLMHGFTYTWMVESDYPNEDNTVYYAFEAEPRSFTIAPEEPMLAGAIEGAEITITTPLQWTIDERVIRSELSEEEFSGEFHVQILFDENTIVEQLTAEQGYQFLVDGTSALTESFTLEQLFATLEGDDAPSIGNLMSLTGETLYWRVKIDPEYPELEQDREVIWSELESFKLESPIVSPFASGTGTEVDPYVITNLDLLQAMKDFLTSHFVLGNDIDASATSGLDWNQGAGFEPIGTNENRFTGKLDGKGKKITGLTINRPNTDNGGLFGIIGSGGVVTDVGLEEINIKGRQNVGGLAGYSVGTITNSYATGSVSGRDRVGGLAGFHDGTITSSYATGSVSGSVSDSGGLVGGNRNGTIAYSYATGSVSGEDVVGGLAGFNIGTIANSYATGSVSGEDVVGGLTGRNDYGTITYSYASGSVSGSGAVSGLTGSNNNGTIINSFWDTQTTGVSASGDDNGEGKSTTEMKQQATFTGWNFQRIWQIEEGESYPWLRIPVLETIVSSFASGTGTEVDPYIIKTVVQLQAMKDFLTSHFVLGNDIDASATSGSDWDQGAGFEPIGTNENRFTGKLDGKDKKITGLTINRPNTDNGGLFGIIGSGGVVTDVGLEEINIKGRQNVGGLAGYSVGIITNSYATGSVSGRDRVGGLAGFHDGTITNSYATGSVTGSGNSVGGLVGGNRNGTIAYSYATGSVSGEDVVGGLAGFNIGTIANSYATGSVSGEDVVGGLTGRNDYGTITNSYASGSVSGSGAVGGLTGSNDNGIITNSYWDTQTSGVSASGDDNGEGKSTTEMKQQATFTGWNFQRIWQIEEGESYPYLRKPQQVTSPEVTLPDPPVLGEVEILTQRSVRISWTSDAAASYLIQVSEKNESEETITWVDVGISTGLTSVITGLNAGKTYLWRVSIVSTEGETLATSEIGEFLIPKAPDVITVSYPSSTDQNVPVSGIYFSWEPDASATKYQVLVYESSNLETPVIDKTLDADGDGIQSYLMDSETTLKYSTNYRWRVIGYNGTIRGERNIWTSFKTRPIIEGGGIRATKLVVIAGYPTRTVSGQPLNAPLVVAVTDAAGLLVESSTASITVTSTSPNVQLSGTRTVTAVNGVATFSGLTLSTLSPSAITKLTFGTIGLTSVATQDITISRPGPDELVVTKAPALVAKNVDFSVDIRVTDASGFLLENDSETTITATLSGSASATLTGTKTQKVVNGIARFNDLKISAAGTQTLTFSAPGFSSISGNISVLADQASVSTRMLAEQLTSSTIPFPIKKSLAEGICKALNLLGTQCARLTVSNNSTTTKTLSGATGSQISNDNEGLLPLLWSAPQDSLFLEFPVTHYAIEFRETGTENWTVFSRPQSPDTVAVITGLKLDTSYDARVAYVTEIGTSEFSEPVTFETLDLQTILDFIEDVADEIIATSIEVEEIPTEFTLYQNYPNPFNPTTTVRFALPEPSEVQLEVYSILGQRIAVLSTGLKPAGYHTVQLDASSWASGSYIYRLRAGDRVFTKKLLLLK